MHFSTRLALAALVVFAAPLACAPERFTLLLPELSDDIAWAALVLEEEGGTINGSTGLLPVRDARLEVEVPGQGGAAVIVYGYRDIDLPPELPRDAAQLAAPLRRASIDEPTLPRSALQVRGEFRDGSRFVPDDTLRDLTAPWVPECATFSATQPDSSILLTCVSRNCRPVATQNRCHLHLDLSGACGLGSLDLKLFSSADPQVRETPSEFGVCLPTEARAGGALALLCERPDLPNCRVDLFPPQSKTALDVIEVKLLPDAPEAYGGGDLLGGLALLDENELVVSAAEDPACLPGGNHQLYFLDRDTLEVTRVVPTPHCVYLMQKDPTGPGFVGLTRRPVFAVRYDRDGNLIDQRLIDGLQALLEPIPLAWSFSWDERSAAAWITTSSRSQREMNLFVEVRWEDLAVINSMPWAGGSSYPVAIVPGGFAFVDDEVDTLRYFDRVGGTELRTVSLTTDSLTTRAYWAMNRLGNEDRLLLMMNSTRESVGLVDARGARRIQNNELAQSPYSAAAIPGHDPLMLLAAGGPVGPAELVVFNPDEEYFLPGRTPLATTDLPVGAVSDSLGPYVYVHFRDTAHVVRVGLR